MSQLVINRLPVPIEVQEIIKEYALLTRERQNILDNNIKIHKYIKCIIIGKNTIDSWFPFDDEPIFEKMFCDKCGNYVYCWYKVPFNINCSCH